MRTCVIDVGGGMRSCFGAGIFDRFMEDGITFDYGLGVSAGASNIASFFSGQKGRMLRFFSIYPERKEYMGIMQFIRHRNFMNMEYIFKTLPSPGGEDPFDIETFKNSSSGFSCVATDAYTGLPVYFDKDDVLTYPFGSVLSATSSLPVINQPTMIAGKPYYDGGFSDPIPYAKAFSMGFDKVLVILTRPKDYFRDPKKDSTFSKILCRKYPMAGKALQNRAKTYNDQLEGMKEYEDKGSLFVLAPKDTCGVTTLKHEKEDVERLYRYGFEDAPSCYAFLRIA